MNKRYYKFVFACLLSLQLSSGLLFAQRTDAVLKDSINTVAIDSIVLQQPKTRKPGNALKWALIPGGGQVYNRSWWKLPLVYGGIMGAIGYAENSQSNYRRAINALEAKCYGVEDPDSCTPTTHEFTGTSLDDISALRNIRDTYDKRRQSAYIFVFLAYILQGVEAYTDAHLKTFDVDEDLSLIKLGPIPQNGALVSYGISVQLDSKRKLKKQQVQLKSLVR